MHKSHIIAKKKKSGHKFFPNHQEIESVSSHLDSGVAL